MKRRLLIIDGAYFAQRVLGQVNMGESENNLETPQEKLEFKNSLKNSLVNIWKTFNNDKTDLIDQIIFVTDFGSWRKDIKPHRPYYVDDNTLIGYKEQRKAKKESSSINYNNFYELCREFVEDIRDLVVVFNINKLEGDDNIMLLANKLKQYPDVFSVIFATDGDLEQVINDNNCIMKNIKTKTAPNGEFIISSNLFGKIYERSKLDVLLGNGFDEIYFKNLFSIQIGDIYGSTKNKRELNSGIKIAKPFKTAFIKSIIGDPKDNIFSLLGWLSKSGDKTFKLTEKKIEKAFEHFGYKLTEEKCKTVLTTKNILHDFIVILKEQNKQQHINDDIIAEHLKHNLLVNMLSVNNVPQEYRDEWLKCWEANEERILTENVPNNLFEKFYVKFNQTAKNGVTNVLADSIPDII